jgi:hypothetical protein
MLRSTVTRSVYLGIKHPYGAYDQIFIAVRLLRVYWYRTLSLIRRRVCRLQLLLVLASAIILRFESRGTCDHVLLCQIRDFVFVASYDSQGYGGGIRSRLHINPLIFIYVFIWLIAKDNILDSNERFAFLYNIHGRKIDLNCLKCLELCIK